jgi:hypothetical protein
MDGKEVVADDLDWLAANSARCSGPGHDGSFNCCRIEAVPGPFSREEEIAESGFVRM